MDEVVNHPQTIERDMFPVVEHPTAGPFAVTGPPVKFSETPGCVGGPAPLLGQHTRLVLSELLNLSGEELDRLEAARIISSTVLVSANASVARE